METLKTILKPRSRSSSRPDTPDMTFNEQQQLYEADNSYEDQLMKNLQDNTRYEETDMDALVRALQKRIKSLEVELQSRVGQVDNRDDALHSQEQKLKAKELEIRQLQTQLLQITPQKHSTLKDDKSDRSPDNLLAARKALKDVLADFPTITNTPGAMRFFRTDAHKFIRDYMITWEQEPVKLQVIHSVMQKSHPDKRATLDRILAQAQDANHFITLVAAHYDHAVNQVLLEELFHKDTAMPHSMAAAGDFSAYLDHLRTNRDKFLYHMGPAAQEDNVLKAFLRNVAPISVREHVFMTYGETAPAADMSNVASILALVEKVRRAAQLKYLATNRTNRPVTRTVAALAKQLPTTCNKCGADDHLANSCTVIDKKEAKVYLPLGKRSAEERENYLANYQWDRQLCAARITGQNCDDIRTCSRTFRHLLSQEEMRQVALGAPILGLPIAGGWEMAKQ